MLGNTFGNTKLYQILKNVWIEIKITTSSFIITAQLCHGCSIQAESENLNKTRVLGRARWSLKEGTIRVGPLLDLLHPQLLKIW